MPEEPPAGNPATPESERPDPPGPGSIVINRRGDSGVVYNAGSNGVVMFIAGATVLPFLQALWAVVGTRVGERLDDATRRALRRILRRELEQGARGSSPEPRILVTEGGTKVQLDPDMPEEALPQLLYMVFDRLEEDADAVLVRWTPAGWLATVARAGRLHDLKWDRGRLDWVGPPPASPAPDEGYAG